MKGRALLLGSATGGLRGVSNDVQAMSGWLGALGLDLDVREGPDATRAGVLEGLARMTRDTRPGEAAVVYYSGHGGFSAMLPEARFAGGRFAPRAFQYLVPTDHDKHRMFRGIFRSELSLAMRGLSERTSNITVILDCCHSTDMVRKDDFLLKAVVEPWSEGLETHVAWLEEQGYDLEQLPELRSSEMVLVSACAAMHKAFEYTRPGDQVRCGLFTDCLLEVVSTAPDTARMTWDAVIRRVVERLPRTRCQQRPQVSGPASRFLFSERRERRIGVHSLVVDGGGWCISGGGVVGVRQGDRYRIVDPIGHDRTRSLAEIVVARVQGHAASVTVVEGNADRLEAGMVALSRPGGPVHQRCRIDGSGSLADELHRRLVEVEGLEAVDGRSANEGDGLAFVLAVGEARVDVLDDEGRALRWPWRDPPDLDPSSRAEHFDGLLDDLRSLVRGSDLLSLARSDGPTKASSSPSHIFEWGRVEGGIPRPLPAHGAELSVGDRIYISVENTEFRPIYVSILDVGVGRAVVLLNRSEPEGIDLGSGETEIIGAPELRSLRGLELSWPDHVPPDGPRSESLVVFISSGPLPVGSWETAPTLEHAVDHAGMRDTEPEPRRSRSPVYIMRHVSFSLHPRRKGQS